MFESKVTVRSLTPEERFTDFILTTNQYIAQTYPPSQDPEQIQANAGEITTPQQFHDFLYATHNLIEQQPRTALFSNFPLNVRDRLAIMDQVPENIRGTNKDFLPQKLSLLISALTAWNLATLSMIDEPYYRIADDKRHKEKPSAIIASFAESSTQVDTLAILLNEYYLQQNGISPSPLISPPVTHA